jgi:hypothetical protein
MQSEIEWHTTSKSWHCVDCHINTAPGWPTDAEAEAHFGANADAEPMEVTLTDLCELYLVKKKVWRAAGMRPWGGCLCIGCLEKRLGRRLQPKDFSPDDPYAHLPCTDRLADRRDFFELPPLIKSFEELDDDRLSITLDGKGLAAWNELMSSREGIEVLRALKQGATWPSREQWAADQRKRGERDDDAAWEEELRWRKDIEASSDRLFAKIEQGVHE